MPYRPPVYPTDAPAEVSPQGTSLIARIIALLASARLRVR